MVVMDLKYYTMLTKRFEDYLAEADEFADCHSERLSHVDVFSSAREFLDEL